MKQYIPILLELNFPLRFEYKIHPSNGYADNPADVPEPSKEYQEPTYWEVKKWFWEKHKMVVCVDINRDKQCHCCIRGYDMGIIIPEDILSDNWKPNFHDSPIIAEMDGINKAIEYLHKQIIK